jgi:hypothetical protein
MRTFPGLSVSYDLDTWELRVSIGDKKYTYVSISPFQNSEFLKRAEKNKGRAMAYIRNFRRKESECT